MVSKIKADVLEATDGGPAVLTRQSACKAWLAAINNAGVPTAQDSLNVSSITDYTTGMHCVNWTNYFSADKKYAIGLSNQFDQSSTQNHHGMLNGVSRWVPEGTSGTSVKTSSCAVSFGTEAGSVYDQDYWGMSVNGDLA